MTNAQFLQDLILKRDAIAAEIKRNKDQTGIAKQVLSPETIDGMKEQLELLSSAIKIMTYGTGPERRRFRRDYERRTAK